MSSGSYIELSPGDFLHFKGSLQLERSKSIANRVLILQAISKKSFQIGDSGNSDDVKVMISALNSKDEKINCGLAGTALRFLSAAYSILPGARILDGEAPLKKRPIKPLIDALLQLGANITYLGEEGYLPLRIVGKELQGGEVNIEQNISSQFVSALMMIGPFLKKGLVINRAGVLRSDSYIELTQQIMEDLSLKVEVKNERIELFPSTVSKKNYEIESDWSSAVYWMAFVCMIPNAKITLKGLFPESKQGDKKLLNVLAPFGLKYTWEDHDLILTNSISKPEHFECDCTSFPDQAQTLAFLCAGLGVSCSLKGLETLSFKETNRIKAIHNELDKMGVTSHYTDSELSFSGMVPEKKLTINTYNDHRMAMAGALLGVQHNVRINDPSVVSKSYPNFWNDLKTFTT